jgi:curved DNA-binding protein
MGLEELLSHLGAGGGARRRGKPAPTTGADLEYELSLDFLSAIRGTTTTIRLSQGDDTETLSVKIPPGVKEGSRIRIRGKGQPGRGGRGDLYIVTRVGEHPYFRRDGNDIYVDVPVSITEATLGAKVDVPTLDGLTTVTVPPGTPSGRKLRLRSKGAPGPTPGDLYVGIQIVPPSKVSAKGAELLQKFDQAEDFNPRANVAWKE